jgi:hypothetical protein
MTISKSASVLAATLVLCACQTTRVQSDTAAESVAACRSYAWLESAAPASDPFVNPLNEQRLRRAIGQRLEARGLTSNSSGADCLVGVAIGSRDGVAEAPRSRWSFGVGTGFGSGGSRSGASVAFGTSTPPREGRIAVDLYRAADRLPLWHGTTNIDTSRFEGANAEKRINAAVDAIFKRYPGAG